MTAYRLLLFWMWPEAKKAFIFSVLCSVLKGKKQVLLLIWWQCEVQNLTFCHMLESNVSRDSERLVFHFFVPVSVCLGERGRGCESSGTGWENPPLPPGGTPSPPTTPSSPSPTTPWGTPVTSLPLSAMYVHQSVFEESFDGSQPHC